MLILVPSHYGRFVEFIRLVHFEMQPWMGCYGFFWEFHARKNSLIMGARVGQERPDPDPIRGETGGIHAWETQF